MGLQMYREFYEAYLGRLPEGDSNNEVSMSNPFREDPNPSMYVNMQTGSYNDFGSDQFKGDPIAWYMEMHDCEFASARTQLEAYLAGKSWIKPISNMEIANYCMSLMSNVQLRKYLTQDRGLSISVIKDYEIGHDGSRYTIPVKNSYGIALNIRKYDPNGIGSMKMLPYAKGYGVNRLYPISSLTNKTVILCEGEWDALLLISKGYNAITTTAGAGSWVSRWSELFSDKDVYICYDVDSAGIKGSVKVGRLISEYANSVKIVKLPLSGEKGDNDISDYFLKHGNDTFEFDELLVAAEDISKFGEVEVISKSAIRTDLNSARGSSFKHKRVSFPVRVIGKDTAPYNIPTKGVFTCPSMNPEDKKCANCAILQSGGELELDMKISPGSLEFIKASKQSQFTQIKARAGIGSKCNEYTYKEKESTNIEEILITPEIEDNNDMGKYVVQTAYFANSSTDTNRSYNMEGVMTPDPWQQHVTFLLDDAQPLQDVVETFQMSPEMNKRLSIFKVNEGQTIREKLSEIHTDFEDNVTHIVGRGDLLVGLDLVYHSVLSFNLQGVRVNKGWLEMLCIGDTRTGKSETTEAIMRHYQLGEMSVAENTSYAGLVGGLQQTGDRRWFLTWGKLPLNDQRLFIIDEASGLLETDIAKMSGIRSSGIAEITKIQTERTTARTRLIWLSNPRSGNSMSSYGHGIQAVAELIGKAEDISRFDFVVSAAKDEVSIDKINRLLSGDTKVPHIYDSKLCKDLVMWAWSRTCEDVEISEAAVKDILKYATAMGEMYSSQIPLVEGANQRIKIARIAVAVACRTFSTDSSGEKVLVDTSHVKFAYEYLNEVYGKPSLNYKGFSIGNFLNNRAAKKYRAAVLLWLDANPQAAELFCKAEFIFTRSIAEQLGMDYSTATNVIYQLVQWRMIEDISGRGYRKTPGFIEILREWEEIRLKIQLEEFEREVQNESTD